MRMTDQSPSEAWVEAANCLATVAHQLSSAIHEANNLLQVIAGSAEMIQCTPGLSAEVVKRTETISEHAHRVSLLLSSTRELAKCPPWGEGQSADLRDVAQRALDLRKHALGRAQIVVSATLGDGPLAAQAGACPMLQAVLNLLLNAEQALRGRRDGRIAVSVKREGDQAVVSIADNGSGFEPEAESGFVLCPDAETSPRLGLGLIAARSACHREGGRLDLTTSAHGTVASLRLPLARS